VFVSPPAARQAVPVPSWLPEVIDQHLTDYLPGPDGLLFTAPEGGPIRRNAFHSRFWLPAVADSVGQPMRFHDLRHSHVALLIADTLNPPWDPSDVDALWSRRTRNTDQGRELT